MTQLQQPRPLCPHLAAAALWMTTRARPIRTGKKFRLGRARRLGAAGDDVMAL
jgi:hypothetical protein